MARMIESLSRYQHVGLLKAYDGKTYQQKANHYLQRVEETLSAHTDQWRDKGSTRGYYIFRACR